MSSRIIKAFRGMTLKKCKSGNKGFKIIRENLFLSFEVETFEKVFMKRWMEFSSNRNKSKIFLVTNASLSFIKINIIFFSTLNIVCFAQVENVKGCFFPYTEWKYF